MPGLASRPRCGRELREVSTDSRPPVAFPACGRPAGHPGYPERCLSADAYRAQLGLQAAVRRGDAEPRGRRERVLRLTFPVLEPGMAEIMCGGVQTGHILAGYSDWTAVLWPVAGERPGHPEAWESVTERTLGELRRALRKRLEDEGPWWS